MARMDRFRTLLLVGDDNIGVRVDYQACDRCGFRLKRVETTFVGDQQLIVARCPICEQFEHDGLGQVDASILAVNRLRYFDAWLAIHDLNRDTLETHYHLRADHFFDDGR